MATWKKVIVSGSTANLANIQVDSLTSGQVVIGGGAAGNLTTTAINGTGTIVATTNASGLVHSGSFSGSFFGDGSGLSGVAASFPVTAKTDLANTDKFFINDGASKFVTYGNSDDVKIGEWVLAVGNPFNLTSTVTAGIVSAKGRNINIIGENGSSSAFPIESFIQTDAAVNPGNSGGALVNTNGELIGINTAIASQTGTYAGYAFAVPVNLVKKVMDDLLEFGKVQRAFLGVQITEINSEVAKEKGLSSTSGIYVAKVNNESAAEAAGIKEGDVIISVADVAVNTTSELTEQVGRHRPGDKINIELFRGEKKKTIAVILRGADNTTAANKKEQINSKTALGADFAELSASEKKNFKINNGIKIQSIKVGKFAASGIRQGFIITRLNSKTVDAVTDVDNIVNDSENNMLTVEGFYPQNPGSRYVYSFNIK